MRTSIVLDDDLVQAARAEMSGRTLRSLVEEGLREMLRRRRRERLATLLGSGIVDLTDADLAAMRRDDASVD